MVCESCKHGSIMREALERLDIKRIRELWEVLAPHLQYPHTDYEVLVGAHYARTQTRTVKTGLRLYSHHWLKERNLPSMLPDHLKARAEREGPKRIAEAVGVSYQLKTKGFEVAAKEIETAMTNAVGNIYADIKSPNPVMVRKEMNFAKKKARKQLLGF